MNKWLSNSLLVAENWSLNKHELSQEPETIFYLALAIKKEKQWVKCR